MVLLLLLVVVAVITNPDKERHKEVLKNKMMEEVQKAVSDDPAASFFGSGEVGQALDVILVGVVVDKILDNFMSIENYIVFSTTKMRWKGEVRTIGIGLFGNVFLIRGIEDNLEGAFSNY